MGLLARPVYQQVPHRIDESTMAAFGCDVCFIGDQGTPVEVIMAEAVERTPDAKSKEMLRGGYELLRATYDAGGFIAHPAQLANRFGDESVQASLDRVNRALFVQQTIGWLTGGDLKLRLYGEGWDTNPAFAPFACGGIENEAMSRLVVRASRINLAIDPNGAADSRVTESIAGGGFYLMRFCPADVMERFYPPLMEACARLGISSNAELRSATDPGVRRLVSFLCRTLGIDVLEGWPLFVPQMLSVASEGRVSSAAAIWSSYPSVTFSTRDELLGLCTRYLYDTQARQQLCEQMRSDLALASGRLRVQVDRGVISRLAPRDGVAA